MPLPISLLIRTLQVCFLDLLNIINWKFSGLEIAEDEDDIVEETSAQQPSGERPTETAGAESEQAPPVGSVESTASAERDGFEVVRIKDLALDEAGQQQQAAKENENAEKTSSTGRCFWNWFG
jgi:hypothetical protein